MRALICTVVLTAFASPALFQSRLGATTYNVPPNPLPDLLDAGDVLNFHSGATPGGPNVPLFSRVDQPGVGIKAGSVINVMGGQFGTILSGGPRNGPGSSLSLYDGALGGGSDLIGGQWNVYGGRIDRGWYMTSGVLDIYGGNLGTPYAVEGGTINFKGGRFESGALMRGLRAPLIFNMSGGELIPWQTSTSLTPVTFFAAAEFNLRGGVISSAVHMGGPQAPSIPSKINIFAQSVELTGNSAPLLLPGVPTVVTQRDEKLSGILADGSPFSFDLNSTRISSSDDYFPTYAVVTVTLVPEPAMSTPALMLALAALVRRRT